MNDLLHDSHLSHFTLLCPSNISEYSKRIRLHTPMEENIILGHRTTVADIQSVHFHLQLFVVHFRQLYQISCSLASKYTSRVMGITDITELLQNETRVYQSVSLEFCSWQWPVNNVIHMRVLLTRWWWPVCLNTLPPNTPPL